MCIRDRGNAIPNNEEGGAWWDGTSSDSAKLIIRNTIFRNNYAVLGGAFYGQGPRELSISHSEFFENTSLTNGGAAYVGPLPMPADLDLSLIHI